jgi:hypothetical protein
MTRSGSSAVAYASAKALGYAVADEPFGPWDRTAAPYNYPREQVELHKLHLSHNEQLCAETVQLAEHVLASIAQQQQSDTVIVKMPHSMIDPAEVAKFWPEHETAFLLRNPLARLNSIYTRGWTDTIRDPFDIETVRIFLHRYMLQDPARRVTFDEFTTTPRRFFRKLWNSWGVSFSDDQIEIATRYKANTYHESSGATIEGRNPHRVLSEHRAAVPSEAADAYLNDPVIGTFLRHVGWHESAGDYVSTP